MTFHSDNPATGTVAAAKDVLRFIAKVRFVPETGCLIWTAGTKPTNGGEGRIGIFKYQGASWSSRRWAAKFIYGEDVQDREVYVTCGEPLCCRHLRVALPIINTRQHYLLVALGYGDDEPEDHKRDRVAREAAAARAAIPADQRCPPVWYAAAIMMEAARGNLG